MKMCGYRAEFFEKLMVWSIKCTKILTENYIKKSLLQVVVEKQRVTCPKYCYLPTQHTLGSTLYLYMTLRLEHDNCQLCLLYQRYRWVTGLIPDFQSVCLQLHFLLSTLLKVIKYLLYFSAVHTIARNSITTVSRFTRACIRSFCVVTCCISVAC